MINITSDKTLKVLLPNMNKALAEAIKSASAEQLTQLGEQKDIKSILASLFDDKLTTQKSDKIILDILKNAPVFKEMGNFSKDIKLLKQELKSRSIPKEIEISLTEFIKNVDSIEPKLLKSQITNSGIFLESKLANPTTFKEIFKEIIQEIKTLLQKSSNKDARQIEQLLEPLIQDENIPSNPKEVTPLLKNITKIIDSISALNEKAKSPQTKELEPIIDDLKKIIKPDVTLNKPLDIKTLIPKIETLYVKVEQSSLPQKMKLLDSIEKIITSLRSIPLPEVLQEKVQLPQIHKDILLKLTDEIKKITHFLESSTIKLDDPVVSKEMNTLNEKLKSFTKPDIPNKILNENIANDAKANLLRLSEEIKQNPQLQNTDIEKLVDKLTLQIDYFQLYSHLNNSSSIYFPFVWDQLEDGGFSIKKGKKDKFYCEINLNLKDYGELKLMLTLYNKNQINLHAYSQSDVLKSGMKEDLELLHSTFKEANLILREIRFFDIKNDKTGGYNEPLRALDVGFEVKI